MVKEYVPSRFSVSLRRSPSSSVTVMRCTVAFRPGVTVIVTLLPALA